MGIVAGKEHLAREVARHDGLALAAIAAVRGWGASRSLALPLSDLDANSLAAATSLGTLARDGAAREGAARAGRGGLEGPLWSALATLAEAEADCIRIFAAAQQKAKDDYDFSAMTLFERGVENADHSDLFSLRGDISAAEMRRRAARDALGTAVWLAIQAGEEGQILLERRLQGGTLPEGLFGAAAQSAPEAPAPERLVAVRPIPLPTWLDGQFEIARSESPAALLLSEGGRWGGLVPALSFGLAGIFMAFLGLIGVGSLSVVWTIALGFLAIGGGLGAWAARRATDEATVEARRIQEDPRVEDVKEHVRAVKWWNLHVGLVNDYLLQVKHGKIPASAEVEENLETIRRTAAALGREGEYVKKTLQHTPLGGIGSHLSRAQSSVPADLRALSAMLDGASGQRQASNLEKEMESWDEFQPPARVSVFGRFLRR